MPSAEPSRAVDEGRDVALVGERTSRVNVNAPGYDDASFLETCRQATHAAEEINRDDPRVLGLHEQSVDAAAVPRPGEPSEGR
jgi:hypothetical protein